MNGESGGHHVCCPVGRKRNLGSVSETNCPSNICGHVCVFKKRVSIWKSKSVVCVCVTTAQLTLVGMGENKRASVQG